MAGIIFLDTTDLERITRFYLDEVGMRRWLSQPEIEILAHDNLLVGFHQSEKADTDALVTFFYPTREEVDAIYERLASRATTAPRENTRYRIYNFFATDPDERRVEFQVFLHELPGI